MKTLTRIFCDNVNKLCVDRDTSIKKLCDEHKELSRGSFYRWQERKISPRLETVQIWADTLGVPAIELLKENGGTNIKGGDNEQ